MCSSQRASRCCALVVLFAVALFSCPSPLSAADDLAILRAAVEERLSSISALEIHYRTSQQPTERSPDVPPLDAAVDWCWTRERESYWSQPSAGSHVPPLRWFFDGRRTYQVDYTAERPDRPRLVFITPGAPSSDLSSKSFYSYFTGQRLQWVEGTLLDGLRSDSARLKWVQTPAGTRMPLVEFSSRGRAGQPLKFEITFDSRTTGMPVRIQVSGTVERSGKGDQSEPVVVWSAAVIESAADATDALSGTALKLPLTGYLESGSGDEVISRILVEAAEVKMNSAIPDSRFAAKFPIGTEVHEFSGKPGELPRRYLIGGKVALDSVLEERKDQVDREIQRLRAAGTRIDARVPARYRWSSWMLIAGAVCLAISGAVACYRMRSS